MHGGSSVGADDGANANEVVGWSVDGLLVGELFEVEAVK